MGTEQVALDMRFQTSLARLGDPAWFTRLTFEDVYEYRWVAFDQTYYLGNRDDFEYALIEIVDSRMIKDMLDLGAYHDEPPGRRFGGVVHEDELKHYRIGFDDHGTYDIVCLRVRIERETGISGSP